MTPIRLRPIQRLSALIAGWLLLSAKWLLGSMGWAHRHVPPVGRLGSHFLNEPNGSAEGWAFDEDASLSGAAECLTRLAFWIPAAERLAARRVVRVMFTAMARDPDYRGLPRVLGRLGRTLSAGHLDPHHCYSYWPEVRPGEETFGLFVFLHGHGPNAPLLLHALRPLADELRMMLIAPSFGYGNWETLGGVAAVERAVDFALSAFRVDPNRVVLVGLSQGGAGVTRAAAAAPARYAGLIFLSGVLERSICESGPLPTGWSGKPVLVIHGERDHNVRFREVVEAIVVLEAAGVRVTTNYHPESDHLLFFARRDEIRQRIKAWIGKEL